MGFLGFCSKLKINPSKFIWLAWKEFNRIEIVGKKRTRPWK